MRHLSLAFALFTLVLCSASRPARAGTYIGGDVNLTRIVGDGSDAFDSGWGFNVRAGWDVGLPVLTLQLGTLFRYSHWTLTNVQDASVKATDILFGGRLGVGVLLKPWVGAYFGYGHLSADVGNMSASDSGTAILIGGGLDIAIPFIAVGIHVDWNKDDASSGAGQTSTGWIGAGANLTLTF